MQPIKIEHPPKLWSPGDPRVEEFMPPVREAISKYIPWPSPQFTDIYNRAYEAVYHAILKHSQEQGKQEETGAPLEIRIEYKNRRRRRGK